MWLLVDALFSLLFARAAMFFLPFRWIAGWLGTPGVEDLSIVADEEIHTAQEIGWAVAVVARRVPWDSRCLAQALAAAGMLRRRGLEGTVSFGACPGDSDGFKAHAWLRVGSCMVTGGAGYERFTAFTTFSRRRP